jgi:hypothetical protein
MQYLALRRGERRGREAVFWYHIVSILLAWKQGGGPVFSEVRNAFCARVKSTSSYT